MGESPPPVTAATVPPPVAEPAPVKAAEPVPVKPAEPVSVVLTFESSPRAEVREGHATLGMTPIKVTREENSTIKLTFGAAGHLSETKTYKFVVPQTFKVELRKEAKPVKPPRKKVPVNDPSELKEME